MPVRDQIPRMTFLGWSYIGGSTPKATSGNIMFTGTETAQHCILRIIMRGSSKKAKYKEISVKRSLLSKKHSLMNSIHRSYVPPSKTKFQLLFWERLLFPSISQAGIHQISYLPKEAMLRSFVSITKPSNYVAISMPIKL